MADQARQPIEHVTTADGAVLAIKRRPNPGGAPAVFLHGLAANADLWNMPDVTTGVCVFRSLAAMLSDAGYDIWLVNLRGHGAPRMPSTPPPGQDDWNLDHFIVYDVPAVIDEVVRRTGRPPVVIGASMGAMTLAGYVQGATLVDDGGAQRVIADPSLAARRQAALAACVFVEFPAALCWPDTLYDERGRIDWRVFLRDWHRNDNAANFPFEVLSRFGWLEALIASVGEVPLSWMQGDPDRPPWYGRLPRPLALKVAEIERAATQGMLRIAGRFTGAEQHRAEVILQGRRYVVDHMKAGVLKQLATCVRERAFISATGTPRHMYSEHYHLVACPTLVVQGGRDRIANPDVTRTAFFDRICAADKQFLLYPDFAHGELEAAPAACALVYPEIIAWLDARRPQPQ